MNNSPILIVEDNPLDYQMTVHALKKAGCSLPVHWEDHGDDALKYLSLDNPGAPPVKQVPLSLVLLDLNIPGTQGKEILRRIKNTSILRAVPVVVFSSSDNPVDVQSAYEQGANSYIQKPLDFNRYFEVIGQLREYWFDLCLLP